MKSKIWTYLILLLIFASCQKTEKKYVHVIGKDIYSPKEDLLRLKGVNLGNWLLPEGYMFKLRNCNSPRKIDQAIRELIGNSATIAFWDAFLDNYITEADIKWLSEAGVNLISLPFDNQLAYTFHKYWMPPVQGEIQQYIDFRAKYNVPILMGESGENEDEWVKSFREILDKNDIHWTFWPYKKLDNTRGPMNFDKPAGYDHFVQYAESDRSTFGKIRALKDSLDGIRPE